MRLFLIAVGRLKAGPERDLCERYLDRARKSARALGLSGPDVIELGESSARRPADRMAAEAVEILAALPPGCGLIVLDPTGQPISSEELSQRVGSLRDGGSRALAFAIGGPDGFDESVRRRADLSIAFGKATFPHQIVRVMLTEQIYRVTTILGGHPYHRA